MEDCNMLVADCIVICCCSQCLILQIIIFVLLKLPCKLIRKTKGYAKKKLIRWGRKEEKIADQRVKGRFLVDEAVELHRSSINIEVVEGFGFAGTGEGHGFRCCIEQAEKVLEELSQKGEFAFGSFWGRSVETSGIMSSSSSPCLANHKFDGISFVQFEEEYLIEMASFSCSS